MVIQPPTRDELQALLGDRLLCAWDAFCAAIEALYDMDRAWNSGGRAWTYEYKYRRGGKTLCALYARQNILGLMMIFGRDEQKKVEALRPRLSAPTLAAYDAATVYHDGKWVMFDESLGLDELTELLAVKRRANRGRTPG